MSHNNGAGGPMVGAGLRHVTEESYHQQAIEFVGSANLFRVIFLKNAKQVLIRLLGPTQVTPNPAEMEAGDMTTMVSMPTGGSVLNWQQYLYRYLSLEPRLPFSLAQNGSPVFRIKSVRCVLLRLAQAAIERKREALIAEDKSPLTTIPIDKNEDRLVKIGELLMSNEMEDDETDDTEDVDMEVKAETDVTDVKEEASDEAVGVAELASSSAMEMVEGEAGAGDSVVNKQGGANNTATLVGPNGDGAADKEELDRVVARRERDTEMTKKWQADTCQLLKDVFKVSLPKREVFHDTLYKDCFEAKNSSGKNKISWSAGSYGLFLRKSKACKPVPKSEAIMTRKLERFRRRHQIWLQENCKSDEIEEVTKWLSSNDKTSVEPEIEPVPSSSTTE